MKIKKKIPPKADQPKAEKKQKIGKLPDLSREQIFDLADASGRKLGFLLALSPLEDEVKEAIMEILDFVTPKQLDQFTQMLEDSYLTANNKELEENFKKEIENLKTTFEEKEKKLEEETLKDLERIESGLVNLNV